MIVQCPSCRALVGVDSVVVDGQRAGLRCSACTAVAWLPTTLTAPSLPARTTTTTTTATPPLTSLPAVSVVPPTTTAVAAIPTLAPPAFTAAAFVPLPHTAVVAGFDDNVIARVMAKIPELQSPSPEQAELAARFTRLLPQWHNEIEHKQLLKAAALINELALVGARYRAVLDVVREEPRARAAQQELVSLAMVTMGQSKTVSSSSGLAVGVKVAAGIITLLVVGGGVVAGVSWMKTSLAPLTAPQE